MKPKSHARARQLRKPAAWLIGPVVLALILSACQPERPPARPLTAGLAATRPTPTLAAPAQPARPIYSPGQLVDYTAQTGDTLPALAARFNTTVREIRTANPNIPDDATTMPPGMPMKIPIYYQPFWGISYLILPDSLFINGPSQVGFDPVSFVQAQPGWFKNYTFFVGDKTLKGGELVAQIATDYSISPRLLLALIEFQCGALSLAERPDPEPDYPLGYIDFNSVGLYRQLLWAANLLNEGYYGWRGGYFKEFTLLDGRLYRLDPWINATTATLQNYFALIAAPEIFEQAVQSGGLSATYRRLFGDPWRDLQPHLPVNLRQPDLRLPFLPGHTWAYTGGPHTAWGDGEPLAAIDFAPPTVAGGCSATNEWATAVADGVIVRTGVGFALLDLDGDGDERSGWVILYLHLATLDKVPLGTRLRSGDPLGHPSCEGGRATGTHIHIARKYNGEWIDAGGPLAFNLENWIVQRGDAPYAGTIARLNTTRRACTCADQDSHVRAEP